MSNFTMIADFPPARRQEKSSALLHANKYPFGQQS